MEYTTVRVPGAIVLLLLVALVAGCSSEPPQGPRSSPDRFVNKSLTLKQKNGSALATLVSVVESYVAQDSYLNSPKSGNFVVVGIGFEHQSGKFAPSRAGFVLKTPNREIVTTSRSPLPYDMQFRPSTDSQLAPGKPVSGLIAFDTTYYSTLTLQAVDESGFVLGQWPLSGGDPIQGDGSSTREVNQSITVRTYTGVAVLTLVSVSESRGGIVEQRMPKNGTFIVVRLKVEVTTGEYLLFPDRYIKLRLPNGTEVSQQDGNGRFGVPREDRFTEYKAAPGQPLTGSIAFDTQPVPGTKVTVGFSAYGDVAAEWPL